MIRRVGLAAALIVAFTSSLATVAVAATPVRVPHATLAMPFHAPYGYIVTVRAGTDVRATGAARLTADGTVWSVRRAADVAALRAAGQLLAVEANALRALQADPLRVDQYAFTQMAVPATAPAAGRKILVIDSGIDLTHPDIALRAPGTTVTANPQEVTGLEGTGDWHGTAVFSTIGAAVDGTGGEGLFPGATIASYDASFFPIPAGCGTGGCVDSAKVLAGLDWAVANDYDIVSMSLGSPGGSAAEYLAVARAVHAGILVVAAAGNEAAEPPPNGNPLNFPAGYEHVISVGATNPDGTWAVFSNFNDWNDVAAPGLDVYAAVPGGFNFTGDVCSPFPTFPAPGTPGWCKVAGTSFSTPLTAAAAAWIWSARPNLTALQVGDVLRAGARPGTGQAGAYDPKFGFGIVDITRSLDPAIAPDPPRDLNEPNDDIIMIKGGAGFGSRDAAILKSTQKARTITAFHDFAEDPSDIYRVDVPKSKKKRWTVSLRLKHAGGDLGVCLWKSNAPTVFFDTKAAARRYLLGCSRQNGVADDTLTVKLKTNTSRIYVDVYTPTNGTFSGQYSLKLTRK